MEGQYPAEPGTDGNVAGGDGQPVGAPPQPVYSQPAYSTPPAYAPPPQYAPYPLAPPPPRQGHTGRLLLIIGLVLVFLLVLGSVVAVLANASLASTYSAGSTVTDYLAAQKAGNATFMMANANYLRGDGSYSQYFDSGGLSAMLAIPQNTDIKDVNVASTTVVDSNTSTVNVTMTWAGHHVVRAYTVHKDMTRVHYNFYPSWRLDIPFATIQLSLPNQPGAISVDGQTLPQGATKTVEVIQGFHQVTMDGTDLYPKVSAAADAIEGSATIAVPGTLSLLAVAAAKTAVKKGFNNCKTIKFACLNKMYYAPNTPGFDYFLIVPGYGNVFYTSYQYTLTRDPTTNVHLVVKSDAGKVAANGTCAYTMTVNGSKKYFLKGTWSGTLSLDSAGSLPFGYDLLLDCLKSKA